MVSFLLLAHGADPTPLDWDEALANLVKFAVTFLLIGFMSYPILEPLMKKQKPAEEESAAAAVNGASGSKNEVVGWIAMAAILVLAVGWWLARTSLVEVMTEEPSRPEEHAHSQEVGGQVAMWGDYHTEVVRVESGELRIYLRDSYNRDISAKFFEAEVAPLAPTKQPDEDIVFQKTTASLNEAYRFLRLDTSIKTYKLKIITPGWSTSLKFSFDESQGKRSLPIWCAPP